MFVASNNRNTVSWLRIPYRVMFETSKIKRSTSASFATYIRYTKCTTRSGATESEVVLGIKANRKRGIILSRARLRFEEF